MVNSIYHLRKGENTMNFMAVIISILLISIILLILVIIGLIGNSACCVVGNEMSSKGFFRRFTFYLS